MSQGTHKGTAIFNGGWWRVRLPAGWHGRAEQHGATFQRNTAGGTLQISSARKDYGQVTEEDLRELAQERAAVGISLVSVKYSHFTGFSADHIAQNLYWREWWLGYDSLVVYGTYVSPLAYNKDEKEDVERILESLRPQ